MLNVSLLKIWYKDAAFTRKNQMNIFPLNHKLASIKLNEGQNFRVKPKNLPDVVYIFFYNQ